MRCRDTPILSTLPEDIWLKIAACLNCAERANLAAVARKFRYLLDYISITFNGDFSGGNAEEKIARGRSFARSDSPA